MVMAVVMTIKIQNKTVPMSNRFKCKVNVESFKYKVQIHLSTHFIHAGQSGASNLYLTPPPRLHRRSSISLLWFFMASL
jgi:hypothetical protein